MTSYQVPYSSACSSTSLIRASRLGIVSEMYGGITRNLQNSLQCHAMLLYVHSTAVNLLHSGRSLCFTLELLSSMLCGGL
eukprot:6031595-Pyramimonas_sp.AAC.1